MTHESYSQQREADFFGGFGSLTVLCMVTYF